VLDANVLEITLILIMSQAESAEALNIANRRLLDTV